MPKAAVIMGSRSDLETMKEAITTLQDFGVDVVSRIVSAHRTPDLMMQFARNAEEKGKKVVEKTGEVTGKAAKDVAEGTKSFVRGNYNPSGFWRRCGQQDSFSSQNPGSYDSIRT